jgi:hypothetical protein
VDYFSNEFVLWLTTPMRIVAAKAATWSHRKCLQGCQMAYFLTKNSDFGKYWRVLQWKISSILLPFCIPCGHLVYFIVIWYIYPDLVCCTNKNLATPNASSARVDLLLS